MFNYSFCKTKLAYIVWYTHIGYNVCAHICAHMIIWSVSHHYLMRRIHVCMHSPNPHPKIQVKSFSQTFNEHPKIHRSFWTWSSLLIHGLSKLIQVPPSPPQPPSLDTWYHDRYINTYMHTCIHTYMQTDRQIDRHIYVYIYIYI